MYIQYSTAECTVHPHAHTIQYSQVDSTATCTNQTKQVTTVRGNRTGHITILGTGILDFPTAEVVAVIYTIIIIIIIIIKPLKCPKVN